jgi:hypothetical protein
MFISKIYFIQKHVKDQANIKKNVFILRNKYKSTLKLVNDMLQNFKFYLENQILFFSQNH